MIPFTPNDRDFVLSLSKRELQSFILLAEGSDALKELAQVAKDKILLVEMLESEDWGQRSSGRVYEKLSALDLEIEL